MLEAYLFIPMGLLQHPLCFILEMYLFYPMGLKLLLQILVCLEIPKITTTTIATTATTFNFELPPQETIGLENWIFCQR